MDNPCVSRGLLVDFANERCYKQSSLIANYGLTWKEVTFNGNGPFTTCGLNASVDCNICNYEGKRIQTIHDGSKFYICTKYLISYSCPVSHPIKINDTTCEYREAF